MKTKHILILATFVLIVLIGVFIIKQQFINDQNILSRNQTRSTDIKTNQIKWYSYEPNEVVLKGKIVKKYAYGPPGYGESPDIDEKIVYYVLLLNQTINVKGDENTPNSDTFKDVREIQLVYFDIDKLKALNNKLVSIKGTLFQAFSGHHYTDVLMNIESIDEI